MHVPVATRSTRPVPTRVPAVRAIHRTARRESVLTLASSVTARSPRSARASTPNAGLATSRTSPHRAGQCSAPTATQGNSPPRDLGRPRNTRDARAATSSTIHPRKHPVGSATPRRRRRCPAPSTSAAPVTARIRLQAIGGHAAALATQARRQRRKGEAPPTPGANPATSPTGSRSPHAPHVTTPWGDWGSTRRPAMQVACRATTAMASPPPAGPPVSLATRTRPTTTRARRAVRPATSSSNCIASGCVRSTRLSFDRHHAPRARPTSDIHANVARFARTDPRRRIGADRTGACRQPRSPEHGEGQSRGCAWPRERHGRLDAPDRPRLGACGRADDSQSRIRAHRMDTCVERMRDGGAGPNRNPGISSGHSREDAESDGTAPGLRGKARTTLGTGLFGNRREGKSQGATSCMAPVWQELQPAAGLLMTSSPLALRRRTSALVQSTVADPFGYQKLPLVPE